MQPDERPPNESTEKSSHTPTVVGIGASAGGLAALKVFFGQVPPDSGLAFVVVVHLSPQHESHLAELLQAYVPIPIQQVTKTVSMEANRVYVIAPDANLNAVDTHLRVTKLEADRSERAPIDHFFRTLADTHDGHSVGVVLTGTGSDGTLGIRDIKAKGGLVIVQDPNEADYDGMPQSAIASGAVDMVLPLAEIPAAILRYDRTEPRVPTGKDDEDVPQDERVLLQKIFTHLRARTDRDFSRYKRSTVLRRIARRMQLAYLEDIEQYLERLREQPDEAKALADDLLITVTHFFRDPEVFERLAAEVIPGLFERKTPEKTIRVWSVGCATGEEAYSISMLLLEEAARRPHHPEIQVFASDLHRRSLDKAREGFYPGDIATDITPARLERFFQKENGGYRIKKEIRDLVVFTPHNVLRDPPFSRLDLISCRNLLIYLERDVQRDVIELFHYSLNAGGTLVLGSAESIDAGDLFRTVDKKVCIFQKRNVPAREPRLPVFPLARTRLADVGVNGASVELMSEPVAYGVFHQRMLERFAPPSILMGPDNRLAHLSQHAGRYLLHPGGEPTVNVFRLVREELRIELQECAHRSRESKQPTTSRPVMVRFNGHVKPVVMHVRPGVEPQLEGFVLVIFEEREAVEEPERTSITAPDPRLDELQVELRVSRQRLQVVIEEYEASQEEMKAANEEMQSTNEELRSTLEELETSKEELQSINEELQTVNQQNRHKVEELAQLSGDLQNLLAATDIATLFLDRTFRILRFTPKLGDLFNIRVTDRGRPISDLTHRLGYTELLDDASLVLSKLIPVERELQDDSGRWYLTRVLPYRTQEDRIEGVVITFVDIDTRKRIEDDLRVVNDALMRANADLKHFSYAASHDIQEPLRTMTSYADLMTEAVAGGNQALIIQSSDRIREGARRMSQLLKDLLSYIGLGESDEAVTHRTDLEATASKVLEHLRSTIESSGATVTFDRLPVTTIRESFASQLLQNLVENSIKYRSQSPPKVHISAVRSNEHWQIGVRDNGIGIDPQYHRQIFEIFKRLHGQELPGSGVGLAISRRIVERYGGHIWVESQAGKGCTVYFTLPAAEREEQAPEDGDV